MYAAVVLIVCVPCSASFAQSLNLTGSVQLDFGVASNDYDVEVTVSNHSFVVISVAPLVIIRPIISQVTETVTIEQGQSSTNFAISGISTDAVDYVIGFRCDDCDGVFSPQYYSPDGNKLSLVNQVYIDPADFPGNLNFTLTSGISISGIVGLEEGKLAKKNLSLLLSIYDSDDPTNLFRRIGLTIPQGSNSTSYSIDKLVRETELSGFYLQLECLNCLTSSVLAIDYPIFLDPAIDHTDINFELAFTDSVFLTPIYYLLLDD